MGTSMNAVTLQELQRVLILSDVVETALYGQAQREDYSVSQSGVIDVNIDLYVSYDDDELTVSLRFSVDSAEFSLGTELKSIWTSAPDEYTLAQDSLRLFVTELVLPTVFPYARASIVTTASRIGFEIPPLPAYTSDQMGDVDAAMLLNGEPSLTLRKKK